jgi:ABC-type antimicrobial peptide transport system permease subunit
MEKIFTILISVIGAIFLSGLLYIYLLIFTNMFKVEIDVTDRKFSNAFGCAMTILILIISFYSYSTTQYAKRNLADAIKVCETKEEIVMELIDKGYIDE